jgi:hypothetical protein
VLVKATRMAITSVASNQLGARPGGGLSAGHPTGCQPSRDDTWQSDRTRHDARVSLALMLLHPYNWLRVKNLVRAGQNRHVA